MLDIRFVDFFPIPLIVSLLILGLICVRSRKRGTKHLVAVILFGLYILAVINVLFFPIYLWDSWPAELTWKNILGTLQDVNLSPFYFLSFTNRPLSLRWLFVDFILNILLTIPFGTGLGYFRKFRLFNIGLWAVGTGLVLEGMQLLLKVLFNNYHVVDINDVILNALGVMIGYALFRLIKWLGSKISKSQRGILK